MEYISKQSLLADLNEATPRSYFAFETMVRVYPTEDVAPVVHSYWIEDGDDYICANCNEIVFPCVSGLQMDKSLKEGKTYWNYCPHCGAKMDGGHNDR